MQHTNQYQFNLIESGDGFSAQPLNENAEKMETALAEQAETIAQCGNCSVGVGTYTGTGTYGKANALTLSFDRTPCLVVIGGVCTGVFIWQEQDGYCQTPLMAFGSSASALYSCSGNTLTWFSSSDADAHLNADNKTYYYVAFYEK